MKNFWQKSASGGKKPILALAPMAGVTDSAFRQMCRKYGADVVYTEMVSADGLYYDSKKTLEFLRFNKKEQPVVIQLFGKDPEKFTKAAELCEKAGFAGIDINFGCPAKKVAGHGGGVTLMRDLDLCYKIIEATMVGTKLPVSVKVRSSINKESIEKINNKLLDRKKTLLMLTPPQPSPSDKGREDVLLLPLTKGEAGRELVTALDFVRHMKDLPIAAVMVHGRSYEKPFDGEIDYGMIKAVKKEFSAASGGRGIVLGNGGIKTPQDAKTMMEKTGCDGVGLARGLYGKPWLFDQTREYLKKGKYSELTSRQLKKAILEHAKFAFQDKNEHGIMELRKHLLWYVAGFPGAREMRKKLVTVENLNDLKTTLNSLII